MLHMSAKKRRGISRKKEITMGGPDREKEVRNGFIVSIVSIAILWWIPIIGPLMAGYATGRKAGNVKNALIVSLIMSAMITFVSLYMISSAIQSMSFVGYYLKDGIYAFSNSQLAGGSNLIVYTQSFNGVIMSMGMVLPSSLIIFNSCSFLGGTVSTTNKEGMGKSRPFAGSVNYSQESSIQGGTRYKQTRHYEDEVMDSSHDIGTYNDHYQEENPVVLSKL